MVLTAQNPTPPKEVVINAEEDPANVTTIADIIRSQESDKGTSVHSFYPCDKVSTKNSYINIGYNITNLVPKYEINLGTNYNYDLAPHFNGDWGVSMQIGHRYQLHRSPVANILWFNIDATYADLTFNHYKAEAGDRLYNSSQTWSHTSDDGTTKDYYFLPWCLEKYETDFGMSVGPSITLDPFRGKESLGNLTFNVFYHIGYHASLMWIQNDLSKDEYQGTASNPINDNIKLLWGHGFMNSFGLNVNWRQIGLGVEKRYGYLNYQSLQQEVFGSNKYKFIDDSMKFYFQVKF